MTALITMEGLLIMTVLMIMEGADNDGNDDNGRFADNDGIDDNGRC